MKKEVLSILAKVDNTNYKPTPIEESLIRIELDNQIRLLEIFLKQTDFGFHVVYGIALQNGFSDKTSLYLAQNTNNEEAKRFLYHFIIKDLTMLLEYVGDDEMVEAIREELDDDLYYGIFDGNKEKMRVVFSELVNDIV